MTTNGGTTMNDLTKAILYTWAPIAIAAAAAVAAFALDRHLTARRAARRQQAWDTHCNHPTVTSKHPATVPSAARPRPARRRPPPSPGQWHDSPCGCSSREQPRTVLTCVKHAKPQLLDLEAMWERREDAR